MIWLDAHLTIMLGVAMTLVVAALVLQQRRTPQATAAWLFALIMLPYVAIPVFLALGFRKKGARFAPVRFSTGTGVLTATSELQAVFSHYGLPSATDGNLFRLIEDGPESWTEVLALVQSAQRTLDITFYRIEDDAFGREFVTALTERAQAGVQVRLIIDRLGGFFRPAAQLRKFCKAGGELRDFSPVFSGRGISHLNLRNHRKMILADGTRLISGGRNIGQDYCGPGQGWVDLSFTLIGPAVAAYADVFHSDWAATGPGAERRIATAQTQGTSVAQLVPSGPDMADDALHDGLVHAMHRANHRIWIATPYFLPTEHLEHALVAAARRGVDVRLLLPHRSNQRIADVARGAYLRELAAAGCTILRHTPGMLHAKAAVIDATACVGSANFDIRSMLLNFELMLFLHDAAAVAQVEAWFERQMSGCARGAPAASLLRRLVEGVFRIGAPIL